MTLRRLDAPRATQAPQVRANVAIAALQTDVATLAAADVALDARLDTEEAATIALDGRVDALEAHSKVSVCFHAVSSAQTAWTNMLLADAFLFDQHRHIRKRDLTGMTECRLLVNKQGTAGAAASKVALKYRTSAAGYSTTVGDYSTIGTSAVECAFSGANVYVDSGWVPLATGAKADVFLAVVGSGGDGVIDPQVGGIDAEFR